MIVFDSSALLALLLQEPGADRVAANLDGACMSSVNFAEVVGYLARRGSTEEKIRNVLGGFSFAIAPFEANDAYRVGLLRPLTEKAGLSLGDRACLSLARLRGAPAMTADRAWVFVAQASGVSIQLIR